MFYVARLSKYFYTILEATGCKVDDDPRARALKLFEDIDVNSDGQLNQQEFLKGCQKDDLLMKQLEKLFMYLAAGLQDEGMSSLSAPVPKTETS